MIAPGKDPPEASPLHAGSNDNVTEGTVTSPETPRKLGDPPTITTHPPNSPSGRKFKLLYEDMRDRFVAYKKKYELEKEKLISDATHVPETGGLMIKPKCSEDHAHGCPDDGDEHKLECKQCKKLFH